MTFNLNKVHFVIRRWTRYKTRFENDIKLIPSNDNYVPNTYKNPDYKVTPEQFYLMSPLTLDTHTHTEYVRVRTRDRERVNVVLSTV